MPVLLGQALAVYAARMRAALADAGYDDVPDSGIYIISGLARRRGGRPLGQLVAELGVSKQAASQLVDLLVVRGYLSREPDQVDRRRLTIALTERGRAAARVVGSARHAIDAALTVAVGAQEFERTRRTLAAITEIATTR